MRLLGRFALVLALLGALLGWIVRAKWGARPGPRFWAATFAPAVVHAAYVTQRAIVAPLAWTATATYVVATVAFVLVAAWAVRRLDGRRRVWASVVPLAHALLHTIATSVLGALFSANAAAPPVVGPALVFAWAIVATAAWWIVLLPRVRPRAWPWRRRRGGAAGGSA